MVWVLLALSLLIILAGAELFTNGVEWIGEGFGLSEGAVGSVLAAVGTALPETLLPLVAILSGKHTGEEIGTGAILGAPFMLTTLAMVVVAVAVLFAARGGRRSTDLTFDVAVIRQDLGYFLVMYGLAMIAGLLNTKALDYALVVVLLVGYVYYVRRHFQTPGEQKLEVEAVSEIKPLHVWNGFRRFKRTTPSGRRTRRPPRRSCRSRSRSDSSSVAPSFSSKRWIRWPTCSRSLRSRSRCWSRRSRPSFQRSSTA